ncbi:hypothetical protein [Granulicella sp. L46]|uniref:hypothetical protein n=1 Tax=Granulicella sp. L46 TaxID=1641865 RepID=UPI00131C8D6F|nr:hypothetical protein [Granulicella sp. L46]
MLIDDNPWAEQRAGERNSKPVLTPKKTKFLRAQASHPEKHWWPALTISQNSHRSQAHWQRFDVCTASRLTNPFGLISHLTM